MQDGQRPIRHLQFAEYKEGDYAMIVNAPKSQNLNWSDARFRKLNLKLQPRYSGPYLISKRMSPVIYVLKVDGFDMKVHATNMKPFTGRKTAITPYAEPGFDRYEANENVVPRPLLLSPDTELNEKSRVRFKKKSVGRLRLHTEAVNTKEDKLRRDNEVRDSISASQEEDWIVKGDLDMGKMSDNDSVLPVEESDEEEEGDKSSRFNESSSSTNITSSNRTTSSSTAGHTTEVETNMLHVEEYDEPSVTCWEEDFKERAKRISSNWEKAFDGKARRSRKRILDVAEITDIDLELDQHMKERIEVWINDITMNEQSRCSRLSKSQLRRESMTTSMEERIGMQLQGRELQWQRRQKISNQCQAPNQLNQFCGLSEVITPIKMSPNIEGINFSDHIPETLLSSQVTMDNENQVILEDCNLLNVEVWNMEEKSEKRCADIEDLEEENGEEGGMSSAYLVGNRQRWVRKHPE